MGEELEIAIDDYAPLEDVVAASWDAGGRIDLTGVTYGRPHWDGPTPTEPYAYYRFLAGLVRHSGAERVLELGTHFGGSALAMCRGMTQQGVLVTIDIGHENILALMQEPRIRRLQGSALDPPLITKIAKVFHHLPIDILYVDADHEFFPTLAMVSIYAQLLKPKYVVLDDITLYQGMTAMWRVLEACHPGEAFDVTKLIPEMTLNMPTATQGFGIIRLR